MYFRDLNPVYRIEHKSYWLYVGAYFTEEPLRGYTRTRRVEYYGMITYQGKFVYEWSYSNTAKEQILFEMAWMIDMLEAWVQGFPFKLDYMYHYDSASRTLQKRPREVAIQYG